MEENFDEMKHIQVTLNLDDSLKNTLANLSRWTKVTGIIIIIFGLLYCLAVLSSESNLIGALLTLGIGIFIVYIGTRLTSTSAFLKALNANGDSKYLVTTFENLRQFFKYSGIIIAAMTLIMFLTLLMITVLGVGLEELMKY